MSQKEAESAEAYKRALANWLKGIREIAGVMERREEAK